MYHKINIFTTIYHYRLLKHSIINAKTSHNVLTNIINVESRQSPSVADARQHAEPARHQGRRRRVLRVQRARQPEGAPHLLVP